MILIPDHHLVAPAQSKTVDHRVVALGRVAGQRDLVRIGAEEGGQLLAGRFAKAAEMACDAADVIFYLTEYDREALERDRVPGQRLARLRPFLAAEALPPLEAKPRSDTIRLRACAMFRTGDKLASYRALASALALVKARNWSLAIVGDGPARAEVPAASI